MKKNLEMKTLREFLDTPGILLLISIAILIILFSLLSPYFFTPTNFRIVIETMVILALLAMGINFLLIGGEIDISFVSVLNLVAVVIALTSPYMSWFVCLILGLLAAIAVGTINGYFTVKVGIPSFLVTLATMVGVQGIVYLISYYRTVPLRSEVIPAIFHGRFLFGFSTSILWAFGILIVSAIILSKTRFGRQTYATGGNERAARMMGISVERTKIQLFIICSIMAAIAAMVALSRSLCARPKLGEGYLMPAIAAPVLGGASLAGGRGSTVKTFFAALLLTLIINGFNLLGMEPAYQDIFMGLILVITLSLRRIIRR